MIYKCLDKKFTACKCPRINSDVVSNDQQLINKLQKPIIRKCKNCKVYSSFKDSIWGFDPDDMQLMNSYNKGIWFLLTIIDIFSKCMGVFFELQSHMCLEAS